MQGWHRHCHQVQLQEASVWGEDDHGVHHTAEALVTRLGCDLCNASVNGTAQGTSAYLNKTYLIMTTQQRRLLPGLAVTYAMQVSMAQLWVRLNEWAPRMH